MNKLIVVTGGTQGIGRAVIEKFAAEGFDIATCSRTAKTLEKLEEAMRRSYPAVKCFIKQADLSEKKQVISFCEFVRKLNRPVDVLVNNAGNFLPGEISTEPEGTLERMINANLYSAYNTTRGLLFLMKEKRKGHIFNLCSVASFMAYPNGGSYAISKFALLGFSKCLREEVKAFGIRVTAVMPGATRTESWNGTNLEEERFMRPEDVAETIYSANALSDRSVVEEIIIRPQLGDL
jgi:short-subunit dehydrogenase